jgi:hypothetical protein
MTILKVDDNNIVLFYDYSKYECSISWIDEHDIYLFVKDSISLAYPFKYKNRNNKVLRLWVLAGLARNENTKNEYAICNVTDVQCMNNFTMATLARV